MNGITPIDTQIDSPESLSEIAQALIPLLEQGSIVGLSGELGAGKTTFTQVLLRMLGVREHAPSPTFVIRRSYDISGSRLGHRFKKLAHVDAYRIEHEDEIPSTGILDDMNDPETLLVVEWPEKLGSVLPSHDQYLGTLAFSHINAGTRHIRFVPSTGR
jgi:tRNA threonylcarbamoyladenosine biosynthesis protein TsaE